MAEGRAAIAWRFARERPYLLLPLLVLIISAVFFLHRVGEHRLQKSDEALFAAAALQMTRTGDVLFPDRGSFGAYDTMGKPPAAIWMIAASISALGRNNFAARLPTALAGVATVMLLYLFGCALSGHRAGGVIAALLALTQSGWVLEARVIWLENFLSAAFLGAIWLDARARAAASPRRSYRWQVGVGLIIGGAALIKHLVGLAPLGAIVLAELLVNPRILLRPAQLLRRFGVTFATTAVVFGWWLIAFLVDQGGDKAVQHLQYKFVADKVSARKGQDVWNNFLHMVEPWVLVAGLACLLALLFMVARRGRRLERSPAEQQRAYLLVAVTGIALSHILVFCTISEKLRSWYLLPVIPLLILAIGTVWGAWLGRRSAGLRLVALLTLAAAAVFALGAYARWYTVFLGAAGLGLLALLVDQLRPLSYLRALPLLGASRLGPSLRQVVAALAIGLLLVAGLRSSSRQVFKDPKPDLFLEYLEEWRAHPPPQVMVDAKHWARWIYMQPMVYWYWSPMQMVPHDLDLPCDLSTLPAGTYMMLHHTSYKCVKPRARQTRNLTPWWRMVRLH